MNYKLIGNSTVELDGDLQFAIGLQWLEPVIGGSKFAQKVKLSQRLAEGKISAGAEYRPSKKMVQSAGVLLDEQKGKVSLASYICFLIQSNTLVFARIEDDAYWVCMKNQDGSIETTSDKVMDGADLENYINERIAVSISGDSLRVVNIGSDFQFEGFDLNDRFEHKPDLIEFSDKNLLKNFTIGNLDANFNQKLIGGVGLLFASVLGGAYYYITTELPEIIQIQQGYYSSSFNSKYSSINRKYKAIVDSNRVGAMDKDMFVREAQKQYNEFILSYPEDSLAPFKVLQRMKEMLPRYSLGWYKSRIAYTDGKYYVSYERLGEWPASVDFITLDQEIVQLSDGNGAELRPLRILNNGKMRLYEFYIPKEYSDAYLKFTQEERLIEDKKARLLAHMSEQKKQLDSLRSSIQETQYSVVNLNLLDKKDPLIAQNVINSIMQDVNKAKKPIGEMKELISEYKKVGEVPVPTHNSTILKENGIEDLIYPMIQRMPFLERSQPQEDAGFPQGIDDRFFRNKTFISKNTIDVKYHLPLDDISSASDLLGKDYVFLSDVVVNLPLEGNEEVSFKIFTHELNRDYAFLNK